MGRHEIDISGSLTWDDGIPRPQWDLVETWLESRFALEARGDAWTAVCKQWLDELGSALGLGYATIESTHFLALASKTEENGHRLLQFAERCRTALLSDLNGVTNFAGQGKQVIVAARNPDHYYRYVAQYCPDGESGGSGGMQIREDYPHIALYGKQLLTLENTLAHELTHVALHHRSMPQWLEEGLAQMFEHNMTGRMMLEVNREMATRHKRYWSRNGLDEFWRGGGFSSADEAQELSYQLAEILVRLMVEESRPRWFGLVREPHLRFLAFLREASDKDCGEVACQQHLRMELSDLAGKFLGPGSWGPEL